MHDAAPSQGCTLFTKKSARSSESNRTLVRHSCRPNTVKCVFGYAGRGSGCNSRNDFKALRLQPPGLGTFLWGLRAATGGSVPQLISRRHRTLWLRKDQYCVFAV